MAMDGIHINKLMTTSVVSVAPGALLADVIQTMINHRYSCIVVIDRDMPVGIITERDIVRLMAGFLREGLRKEVTVEQVMSTPVMSVSHKATLFEALVISTAQKIRHLPVVDEQGRLAGLVTQSDLAQAHFQVFEKQREIIESCVISRTKELQQAYDQLKSLSMMDALMGIGNRRAMEVDLDHTHALAVRYRRSYAVCLFDVDFFKLYNDTKGHLAGDEALTKLAGYLLTRIRKSDRLYRYGGEEILLLLPETPLDGARILAERTLAGLVEQKFPHSVSPYGVLTMSCGIAVLSPDVRYDSWRDVVALADQALYDAKLAGRNRAACRPGAAPVQIPATETEGP